jgi:prepilin-type N-terminal cleavage/methylation domain-containing protein
VIQTGPKRDRARSGFTLVELLVAIAVIVLLIGLMLPAVGRVRSTTHRVVCSSNIRQVGLGLAMYTDVNRGVLPPSVFVGAPSGVADAPLETVLLRIGDTSVFQARAHDSQTSAFAANPRAFWDGLGILHGAGFLDAPGVFFCPAHSGNHRFSDERELWADTSKDLFGNFQYRGEGPDGLRDLWRIVPRDSVIVSDSLRPRDQLNHKDGTNILRADLAVLWFADPEQSLVALSRSGRTAEAWDVLDDFGGSSGDETPGQ